MAKTWVTVRVEDEFAKELSLLAKAEGYEDRSKFLRYVLQSYVDENLFLALQGHLMKLCRPRHRWLHPTIPKAAPTVYHGNGPVSRVFI